MNDERLLRLLIRFLVSPAAQAPSLLMLVPNGRAITAVPCARVCEAVLPRPSERADVQ